MNTGKIYRLNSVLEWGYIAEDVTDKSYGFDTKLLLDDHVEEKVDEPVRFSTKGSVVVEIKRAEPEQELAAAATA